MSIGTIVMTLNFSSAIAAFVAAFLWHRSATVQVFHKDEPDESGIYSAAIIVGDSVDFISTAIAQSVWSKRGAYAAAVAAFLQGTSLFLQSAAA